MAMYEYITNEGYRLLQRMLMGEVTLDFTRVEMGDGNSPETDLKKVTALSNAVVSLEVDSVVKQENNTISISALFTNEKLEKGFYFREKGVFAKGLDGSGTEQEILFAYANAADTANYIDPPTVELVEKKIISHCTQCQKTDGVIDIVIKSGIYADIEYVNQIKDTLETHLLNKKNPHGVDAKQLGLDKVDNTSDTDKPVSILQKQAIDDSKTADTVAGANPTAMNSTDGKPNYINMGGYQEQVGKSYFTGLTVLNDGVDTNEITCKTGDTVSVVCDKTYSVIYLKSYRNENTTLTGSLVEVKTFNNTNTINEVIDYEGTERIVISFMGGSTTDNVTVKINGSDGTTPSPDNPIHISANGDKGYFDGDLVTGYLDLTTGALTGASGVTCKNPIPCKENDVVTLFFDGEQGVDFLKLRIVFYDESGVFLSTGETDSDNTLELIAPNNTSYMKFHASTKNETVTLPTTPSNAPHICVTINGQYAVRVKSVNRNLCPTFEKSVGANASYYTDSFSVKGDSTYTISFIKERISGSTISNTSLYGYAKVLEYDEKMNLLGTVSGTVASLPSGSHKFVNQITTKPQTKHIAIDFNNNNGESALNTKVYDVQVEEGTEATPYEPHQETTALIPVSSPFYEGDYIEVYADGSGREYRENAVWYLSDTLGWSNIYGTTNTAYYCNIPSSIKDNIKLAVSGGSPDAKCNIAVADTWANVKQKQGTFCLSYDGDCGFHYDGTLEEFKESYTQSNAYIVYKLKEPTTTPLTAEQVKEFLKLRTYKGVTHVTADGEVVMRYYVNTDSGDSVSRLQGSLPQAYSQEFKWTTPQQYATQHFDFKFSKKCNKVPTVMVTIRDADGIIACVHDTTENECSVTITNIFEYTAPVAINGSIDILVI